MGVISRIQVVAPDPKWAEMFREEATQITQILGSEAIAIHHIGSTSVPGLWAKPIIDILLVVKSLNRLNVFLPALQVVGYTSMGENGIPGRHFFAKGGDEKRSHHIHAYEPGHPEITSHLVFRDYLIVHPDIAHQYSELKQSLAQQFPHDIQQYNAGKSALIQAILAAGEIWQQPSQL